MALVVMAAVANDDALSASPEPTNLRRLDASAVSPGAVVRIPTNVM